MGSDELTVDWSRCVYVTGRIGDDLVAKLAPEILKLRQAGDSPITVAINSPGGSVSAMDALLSLITGPDQDGRRCVAITIVTNEAFSAAASMLAFGSYSIALPHTSILLHDLRYGGLQDVTPDKAKNAARQLQSANESFALRLANVVFKRLTWLYIDVRSDFSRLRQDNETYKRYAEVIKSCSVAPTDTVDIDIAALAAKIHRHLTGPNRKLLDQAVEQLSNWAAAMNAARFTPMYAQEDGAAGLLDGARNLYRALQRENDASPAFGSDQKAEDLRLFLLLAMAQLVSGRGSTVAALENAVADLALMDSINDPSHTDTASRLMLRHQSAFFKPAAMTILAGEDSAAKQAVMTEVRPYVKVLWHLCVLLCRELVTGDHTLNPVEALMFGLVDEVPGDTTIESRRQFRVKMEQQSAKKKHVPRRLRKRIV